MPRALPRRAFPLALAATLLLAGPLAAQPLTVPIDHSMRLNVAGSAASVVVGNPQVADVTVVDSHTVFVSGRGYGETDVVVLDGAGRTIYSGEVMVGQQSAGQVSVYRGSERTDMACAPGCEVSFRSPTKGGSSGSSGGAVPAGAAQGSGGGLGQVISSAVGAAGNAVGHSMTPVAQ